MLIMISVYEYTELYYTCLDVYYKSIMCVCAYACLSRNSIHVYVIYTR